MSGMEPMLIGAALGGGISAARGGNPLTGALLGGITGGVGGGIWNAAQGAAGAASTSATGGGFAGGGYGSIGLPAQTAIGASPSIGSTISNLPSAIGNYIKSNPSDALKIGGSLLGNQQQIQAPSAGLMHGQVAPMAQDQTYSLGAPKISLI